MCHSRTSAAAQNLSVSKDKSRHANFLRGGEPCRQKNKQGLFHIRERHMGDAAPTAPYDMP